MNTVIARWIARVRGLLRRDAIDAESTDELRFHLDMEVEAQIARGVSPVQARRAALRDLGGLTQTCEAVRDVRMTWLDVLWLDIRHACRLLRRTPAFSAMAVVVLGLGIGANVAIFSIFNAAFLRALPTRAPDELAYIYEKTPSYGLRPTDYRDLAFFRDNSDVFTGVTSHASQSALISIDNETEQLNGELVAANYFDVIGVPAALGRTFRPEEDRVATPELAIVIGHDLWTRRLNADPHALGRQIRIESKVFTIVGIMAPGFNGLSDPWTPSQFWITQTQFLGRENTGSSAGLVGRLKPGVSVASAQAEVGVLGEQVQRERIEEFHLPKTVLMPYVIRRASDVHVPFAPDSTTVPARVMTAVTIVAAIVLLIAAANIAGLLTARGVARTSELAVRRGLGASGIRLIRQLLTETTVLSLAGGAVGLFVASVLINLYRVSTPDSFLVSVPLDLRVIVFTVAVCAVTGLLVGAAPARQALRIDVVAALGGGAGTTKRVRASFRQWILVPQIGLALVLLMLAALRLRALPSVAFTNLGYRVDDDVIVLSATIGSTGGFIPSDKAAAQAAIDKEAARTRLFHQRLFDNLRDIPDVTVAAVAKVLPVFGTGLLTPTFISRDSLAIKGSPIVGPFYTSPVSLGFFRTLGISIIRGRDFNERDVLTAPPVAIISAGLAKRLWPNEDALGKSFTTKDTPDTPDASLHWLEVVGVIGEVNPITASPVEAPKVFVPIAQQWRAPFEMAILARGPGAPSPLMVEHLKAAVTQADPLASVFQVRTMAQMADSVLHDRQLAATILSASGIVGLSLASLGLYGVISFSVAHRRREIGIRATLGAQRGQIIALVLREGMTVTALGCAIGFPLSFAAMRVASNLVKPVPNGDVLTYIAVPLVLVSVVLAACYIPAWRASRVNPVDVLRES